MYIMIQCLQIYNVAYRYMYMRVWDPRTLLFTFDCFDGRVFP